ncbi:3360_t:CDS:1, partial [Paraglomus occultum]
RMNGMNNCGKRENGIYLAPDPQETSNTLTMTTKKKWCIQKDAKLPTITRYMNRIKIEGEKEKVPGSRPKSTGSEYAICLQHQLHLEADSYILEEKNLNCFLKHVTCRPLNNFFK